MSFRERIEKAEERVRDCRRELTRAKARLNALKIADQREREECEIEKNAALSVRTRNALLRNYVETEEQARRLSDEEILAWPNVGEKTLQEIRSVLGA